MDAGETLESKINRSEYKILIVDDVVSNVLLLKILLTNEKFQVCTANNGTSCIEMAKKEHPDLILLDVMMPDISGFDTAVILKKDDETKETTYLIETDNSYFIEDESGYSLFINGEYKLSFNYIPEDFKDLPIYQKED